MVRVSSQTTLLHLRSVHCLVPPLVRLVHILHFLEDCDRCLSRQALPGLHRQATTAQVAVMYDLTAFLVLTLSRAVPH
eukprot:12107-Eustigmatos_ZCMA.PRE.1